MPFDIEAAKKAGYTDEEIQQYIASKPKPFDITADQFDVEGAIKAGYTEKDIADHLAKKNIGQVKQPELTASQKFNTYMKSKYGDAYKEPTEQEWSDIFGNIPESFSNMVGNMKQAVTHPLDTLVAIKNAFTTPEGKQAVGDFMASRIMNPKQTIIQDPVGAAMDIASVAGGIGAGLKTVGAVSNIPNITKVGQIASTTSQFLDPISLTAKGVKTAITGGTIGGRKVGGLGELGAQWLGMTTGAGPEAIRQSVKSKSFLPALRGKITQEGVLSEARDALQEIRNTRGEQYRERLENLQKISGPIDITPVKKELDKIRKQWNIGKTVTYDENGIPKIEYDFSESALRKQGASDVKEMFETVENWGKNPDSFSPAKLDILKRQLGDFYSDSKISRVIVKQLEGKVKDVITKAVPEYAVMEKDYAKYTEIINETERALSLGRKDMADTALRKLSSTMRENFTFRDSLVAKMEEMTGRDIRGAVAGTEMSQFIPKGLVGKGLAFGGVFGAIGTNYWPMLIMSSPRVVGEFLGVYGKAARGLQNAYKNANRGIDIPSTYSLMNQTSFQGGRIKDIQGATQ